MHKQKSFKNERPTLYLVATPIGNLEEITYRAIQTLKDVEIIACEDTRQTKKLCTHFDIKTKLVSHHEHNLNTAIPKLIETLLLGSDVALVSDAGYPAISDPGYELVVKAIENEINVVPISGANACLNALVVSGIRPQPFLFYGFVDAKESKRVKQLVELKDYPYTIVFYEAPHRIAKTLANMKEVFGNRKIALCREITKLHEEIIRGSIEEVLEADNLKGEMVIVVEGKQELPKVYESSIEEHLEMYLKEGMESKEAIKKVAKDRGIPKNEVYRVYHHQEDNHE